MGFHVSQLRSVPIGEFEYYIYFIDAARHESHTQALANLLLKLVISADTDAAIVSGPPSLSDELNAFLARHAPAHFARLDRLLNNVTCLMISKGAIQTTKEETFVIPLALADSDMSSQEGLVEGIMTPLIEAMQKNKVDDFCRSLGAEEIPLSDIKSGLLVTTLRHANRVLELKPNCIGLGLNLNAVLEDLLGPPQRA
jgi:hypothetical protein